METMASLTDSASANSRCSDLTEGGMGVVSLDHGRSRAAAPISPVAFGAHPTGHRVPYSLSFVITHAEVACPR